MKSEYFRFLYWEMKACMVHLGKVKDTLTGEQLTFLYVRGGLPNVERAESDGIADADRREIADERGNSASLEVKAVNPRELSGSLGKGASNVLFACPRELDLVVLGNVGKQADGVLADILEFARVKLLVLPESGYRWSADFSKVEEVCFLHTGKGQTAGARDAGKETATTRRAAGKEAFELKGQTAGKGAFEPERQTEGLEAVEPEGRAAGKQVVMLEHVAGKRAVVSEEQVTEREGSDSMRIRKAGWDVFLKCYAEGSVTMLHGPKWRPGPVQERNLEPAGTQAGTGVSAAENLQTGKIAGADKEMWKEKEAKSEKEIFDDCVMSVKVLDREVRCRCGEAEDEFACAMGCALKKDHDVCRYQRLAECGSWLAGTLLAGDAACLEQVQAEMGAELETVRFFCLPLKGEAAEKMEEASPVETGMQGKAAEDIPLQAGMKRESIEALAREFKRYYIGCAPELGEEGLSWICGSGLYQVPVVLREGTGICCSGMLTYAKAADE